MVGCDGFVFFMGFTMCWGFYRSGKGAIMSSFEIRDEVAVLAATLACREGVSQPVE